jgi:putative GTP pyrophosphokinase
VIAVSKILDQLQNEYYSNSSLALRFATSLRDEIEELLRSKKIPLGVPIECRVKKFESISEKIKNKSLNLDKITDLPDLIGLRLILLFSRDVRKTCDLLSETFSVLHKEDTQARLGESQFGYQSFHYIVKLPETWLSVPSYSLTGDFQVEIQIRTLAQHIWAASSHIFQYKQESAVPLPVRRSIHRVSALLETVDLEFERVLEARESYLSKIDINEPTGPLNVDLLARILDTLLPVANKHAEDRYDDLLKDLLHFSIDSPKELQSVVSKHMKKILETDAKRVSEEQELVTRNQSDLEADSLARIKNGVFFTHVGLARLAIEEEVGKEKFLDYMIENVQKQA